MKKKTFNSSFRTIKNIGIVHIYRIFAGSMYKNLYILALIIGRRLGFAILLTMIFIVKTYISTKYLCYVKHNFFLPPMVLVTREYCSIYCDKVYYFNIEIVILNRRWSTRTIYSLFNDLISWFAILQKHSLIVRI